MPRGPTRPRPEPERARAAQRREQERATRKKKRIRRRERREQRSEEFRLHEQQGLSSPVTSEYSSSDEEEESDGGRALPERWELAPPRPEPRRRQRRQCLGRAWERPPPGSPRER
jgi:hypothetical protein